MGTPEFALPSLRRLVQDGYDIVGVYTRADQPAGRGRAVTPPPVKTAALELGLPVFQPSSLRTPEAVEELASLRPDVIVVCAFGQILRQPVLDIPPKGVVNVHPSLLPAPPRRYAYSDGHPRRRRGDGRHHHARGRGHGHRPHPEPALPRCLTLGQRRQPGREAVPAGRRPAERDAAPLAGRQHRAAAPGRSPGHLHVAHREGGCGHRLDAAGGGHLAAGASDEPLARRAHAAGRRDAPHLGGMAPARRRAAPASPARCSPYRQRRARSCRPRRSKRPSPFRRARAFWCSCVCSGRAGGRCRRRSSSAASVTCSAAGWGQRR